MAHWKIPIPIELEYGVEEELSSLGLFYSANRLEMDLAGVLHAYDVDIYGRALDVPLFSAKQISIRFSLWSLFANKKVVIKEWYIVNGNLFYPPIYSPSGTELKLVESLNINFQQERYSWNIKNLSGIFLGIKLFGSGRVNKEVLTAGTDFQGKSKGLDQWMFQLGEVLGYKKYIETLKNLSGVFNVKAEGHRTEIEINFFADEWESLQGAYASNIRGALTATALSMTNFYCEHPFTLILKDFHWEPYLSALRAFVQIETTGNLKNWSDVYFVGNDVRSSYFDAAALGAKLNLDLLPHQLGAYWVLAGDSFLKGDLDWNWSTQSGEGRFDGIIHPDVCKSFLDPYSWRHYISEINFKEPLRISGSINIQAGFQLEYAELRAQTGLAVLADRWVQNAFAKAFVTKEQVWFEDIAVYGPGWTLRGNAKQHFGDSSFRFLLYDSFDPKLLNVWLPDWWTGIWRPLSFYQTFLAGDIDIQGSWEHIEEVSLYANAQVIDCYYEQQYVPFAKSRVLLSQGNVLLDEFLIEDPLGCASGSVCWQFGQKMDGLKRCYIDLESTLPLTYFELISFARHYVDMFECSQPPKIIFSGELFSQESILTKKDNFTLTAFAEGPLAFLEIPLGQLSFVAFSNGPLIFIDPIDCKIAGGVGSGYAEWAPESRDLTLSCHLSDVDRYEVMNSFAFLKSFEEPFSKTRSNENARPPAILNASFSIKGNTDDFSSFSGQGNVSLMEKGLGEIHFLGGLSKLINAALILPIASFSLDEAHSSFLLKENLIYFPDAEITGSTMKIFAEGSYSIPDQGLNFRLSIFPCGEVPVLSQALLLLAPLNEALALQLTGTLNDPVWRFAHLAGKKQAKLSKIAHQK